MSTARSVGGIETVQAGGDPETWLAGHRDELAGLVARHGAVLVRGLGVATPADVARARDALGLVPTEPREAFAPRTALGEDIWSAPDWAADREMCLQHEQAHALEAPRLLLLGVLRPPDSGGELLLGDTRAALGRLPARVADRARRQGWLLVRNFRPHFGLPWSAAYDQPDRTALEAQLAAALVGTRWTGDVLHTEQRRPAVLTHPVTGEDCWVNQLAFFSAWSVDRAERDVLLGAFGPDGIPFSTAYGDGEPLPEEDWRAVLDAYDEVLVAVPPRAGDLLLVDNLLAAHGRRPYTGRRDLAVALTEPVRTADCAPPGQVGPGPG